MLWDCGALLKTKELEARICSGVSILAPSFTICHSHLNATLGPKDATCKVVQTTDYQSAALSPDDPTFRTLLFRQAPTESDLDYCCLAPPTLESAAHSTTNELGGRMLDKDGIDLTPPTVGLETRYFPLTAVKEVCDEAAIARCEESLPSFTDAVKTMLEAMRLFSFCAPTLPADADDSPEEGGEEGAAAEGSEAPPAEGGGDAEAAVEGGEAPAAPAADAAEAAPAPAAEGEAAAS